MAISGPNTVAGDEIRTHDPNLEKVVLHARLKTTARYSHVATRTSPSVKSPFETIGGAETEPDCRCAAAPRAVLGVADIFRDHGPAWRAANAVHVSLAQLRVISAIETCLTCSWCRCRMAPSPCASPWRRSGRGGGAKGHRSISGRVGFARTNLI